MMTSTLRALMANVGTPRQDIKELLNDKVAVVGAGTIGTAIAFALLAQKITTELVLIDEDEDLVRGEMLDIQQAAMYLDNPKITDYDLLFNCRICIVTTGVGAIGSKQEIVKVNTKIYKDIIRELVYRSPEAILIIVTNPVDVMSYVAWKLSGFPSHRVIGVGTILSSARFRYLLAQELEVSTSSLHAFVIGEQGMNSIPVWSGVSVSGVRLRDVNSELGTDEDPEDWAEIHKQVVQSEYEVERFKSRGSWGMALSVTRIVKAILDDTKKCYPISTHITGCRHGIDKDVFLSLPCVLGSQGVCYIVKQDLNEKEKKLLQKSADGIHELQKNLLLLL